jgi:selenocysteine-specific elongation factor
MRRAEGHILQEELRKYPRGVSVAALLKATVAPNSDLDRLEGRRVGDWIFSDEAWRSIASRATHELEAYHGAYPLRPGMAREELRSRLGVTAASFASVVQGLVEDGRVVERNESLAAPSHDVAVDGGDLLRLLKEGGFAPPSLPDAMRKAGVTEEVVRALAQRGDIVRVSDDVAFGKDAYESAVELVNELIAAYGSVTVAQLRDRMGASRRPVLALLEHLDARHVTRRVGDARVLR